MRGRKSPLPSSSECLRLCQLSCGVNNTQRAASYRDLYLVSGAAMCFAVMEAVGRPQTANSSRMLRDQDCCHVQVWEFVETLISARVSRCLGKLRQIQAEKKPV